MKKNTSELLKELKECSDFKRFYKENESNIPDTKLSDYLQELINKKGLKKSDIIKKSEMSEVYAYQIISGLRVPERNKLLCLAIGMELDLDETQELLKSTGYPQLYVKNTYDCFIIYALCRHLSVMELNEMLYDYGEDTLG